VYDNYKHSLFYKYLVQNGGKLISQLINIPELRNLDEFLETGVSEKLIKIKM